MAVDSLTFDVRVGGELFFAEAVFFAAADVFPGALAAAVPAARAAACFFAGVFLVEDVLDVLRAAMGCAPCRWIGGL
jgi:hypothetical protein